MRILLAIVHYFAAEDGARHSSLKADQRESRHAAVMRMIEGYRALFDRPAMLDLEVHRILQLPDSGDTLDIALVTVPGCSLPDDAFLARHRVTRIEVRPDNPRMLGFHVHDLFARLRGAYDMFVYSEDDLLAVDPDLFTKVAWFAGRSGGRRVLSPNRFERDAQGVAIKTYVDGDLPMKWIGPILEHGPADENEVVLEAFGRPRSFRRARNPHSGFFAITQGQLGYWMRQPHWGSRNSGFVSPLESAATLGVSRTFALYKPSGSSAAFLELEHLDLRFARLDWAREDDSVDALRALQSLERQDFGTGERPD